MSDAATAHVASIVRIVGRWALLDTGRWVTPVPAFKDLDYDDREFDRHVHAFQTDPISEIQRHGFVEVGRSV